MIKSPIHTCEILGNGDCKTQQKASCNLLIFLYILTHFRKIDKSIKGTEYGACQRVIVQAEAKVKQDLLTALSGISQTPGIITSLSLNTQRKGKTLELLNSLKLEAKR